MDKGRPRAPQAGPPGEVPGSNDHHGDDGVAAAAAASSVTNCQASETKRTISVSQIAIFLFFLKRRDPLRPPEGSSGGGTATSNNGWVLDGTNNEMERCVGIFIIVISIYLRESEVSL